ncbi:hypothetical protein [Brevibacterium casei]|uniref:hypothetical protein n=1 Tax=Brevibacterium casei TaxID=33889 RepID=UPI0021D79F95|nr:hypothetical protein [Brevibacterium casei]
MSQVGGTFQLIGQTIDLSAPLKQSLFSILHPGSNKVMVLVSDRDSDDGDVTVDEGDLLNGTATHTDYGYFVATISCGDRCFLDARIANNEVPDGHH